MYCGTATRVVIFSHRNQSLFHSRGKHFVHNEKAFETKFQSGFFRMCSLFISNINSSIKSNGFTKELKLFHAQNILIRYLRYEMSKLPICLKKHSVNIVRMCTQQCECVVAHRIRRGQQIFSLYTKLWDEVALKELVCRMRQRLSRRGKELLFSAVGVSAYNWEKTRISDEEIQGYMDELEIVYNLRNFTVTCQHCQLRMVIDVELPSIKYCTCPGSKPVSNKIQGDNDWLPFMERKDLLIWRKENEKHSGLYAYKVYGKYDDVTAEDFLRVQVDTNYRREWDTTAVKLEVLESDPDSNSDVIYWEMQWPRMFSNRDYVFSRRFKVDEQKSIMLVVNKGTEHPNCPKRPENHRVTEYWSYMVIKPLSCFNEPGIEFSLTYFDNPGVSIPSTITSWVAMSGLPDFLGRVREAARVLASRRKSAVEELDLLSEREPEVIPLSIPDANHKMNADLVTVLDQEPEDQPSTEVSQESPKDRGEESDTKPMEEEEEPVKLKEEPEEDNAEPVLKPQLNIPQVPESLSVPDFDQKPTPEENKPVKSDASSDTEPTKTHSTHQEPQEGSYLKFQSSNLFV